MNRCHRATNGVITGQNRMKTGRYHGRKTLQKSWVDREYLIVTQLRIEGFIDWELFPGCLPGGSPVKSNASTAKLSNKVGRWYSILWLIVVNSG